MRTSPISVCTCAVADARSCVGSLEVGGGEVPDGLEREREAGEGRAEPVVEIASDPPALLLP